MVKATYRLGISRDVTLNPWVLALAVERALEAAAETAPTGYVPASVTVEETPLLWSQSLFFIVVRLTEEAAGV